jgi:hypothetical protein
MTGLQDVADPLLKLALTFLPIDLGLYSFVMPVSRRFRAVAQQMLKELTVVRVRIVLFDVMNPKLLIEHLTRTRVRELYVSPSSDVVELPRSPPHPAVVLAQDLPNLERFSTHGCSWSEVLDNMLHLTQLSTLELKGRGHVQDTRSFARMIAETQWPIDHLVMNDSNSFSGWLGFFDFHKWSRWPLLQTLHIATNEIPAIWESLNRCSSLTSFRFRFGLPKLNAQMMTDRDYVWRVLDNMCKALFAAKAPLEDVQVAIVCQDPTYHPSRHVNNTSCVASFVESWFVHGNLRSFCFDGTKSALFGFTPKSDLAVMLNAVQAVVERMDMLERKRTDEVLRQCRQMWKHIKHLEVLPCGFPLLDDLSE